MELKDIKTCELVKELEKREGIVKYGLDNYETICEILDDSEGERIIEAQYTGPGTTILIVAD